MTEKHSTLAVPAGSARLPASRVVQWLFGVGLVLAVAVVATHMDEQRALVVLFRRISPAWLLLAMSLQLGTYLAEWTRQSRRAASAERC